MTYVDGFLLAVPKKNVAAYKKMATVAAKVWMDYGALSYVEAVADDVKSGKWTSFPQAVKLKKGEVVIFSWITYKSRKSRDAILGKVMKDERLAKYMSGAKKMPFDGKRMIFGGFKSIVEK